MSDKMRKVLHAFAALADLGEEIAGSSDFEEMVNSSLHVVLGALGVRRGAVAEYDHRAGLLRFVAARGFPGAAPADVPLTEADAARIRAGGAEGVSLAPAGSPTRSNGGAALQHGAGPASRLGLPGVELLTPMVVRGDLVGVILLGGKASDEPFGREDREVVRSLARH
ncbi:MAG TPA: GAF domain-containing protein, partial [Pyrinomonadaceae bacterium]|nr:GAF domain-containing protein [Pyrinomonadaceae bacterium]